MRTSRHFLGRALATGLAVASAALLATPTAALAESAPQKPWAAVVQHGDSIRVERVDASASGEAIRRVDQETGGAPIVALAPDSRVQIAQVSLDPLRISQWALDQVPFESARAAVNPSDVVVAVVDTGVDAAHEDLAGVVLPGWDTINNAPGGHSDPNGHGTHVAGIIAAVAGNGRGVVGAAAGVRILPVRALANDGGGWSSDIAEGIRWAADHGADVINLSLGGPAAASIYRAAINYAVNTKGAVVVAAAGNDYENGNPVEYPAADPDAVAVGATTSLGQRASFSNTGTHVDLAAPGALILAPCPAAATNCGDLSGYALMSGTSMATPHVAAAAALVRAAQPSASPAQVRSWLETTATDAGAAGRDAEFGAGIVAPARAVAAATGANPAPATPAPGATPLVSPSGGYWMVAADGAVYAFGGARALGNAPVGAAQAVDLEPTPSRNGYWVVDDQGRVMSFGDATGRGNVDRAKLAAGESVTSLSATRSGNGYWIFTSRGRVLPFGDARFFGDVSDRKLSGPVLDSVPTPTGEGYYMVASDGGIFAFGDARFRGSMGGRPVNAPVQSLVPDSDGTGYWLVASDGGIFAFDASFKGSMGGTHLNRPVTGMVQLGGGYLMVGEDGGVFNFSNQPFFGSLAGRPPARPVVSVAVV